MNGDLGQVRAEPLEGSERLALGGRPLPHSVLDFWRWSVSDLLSNATRGILAEFIVACDLGCLTEVRGEWDAFDLVTQTGVTVEVKAAGYLQSWHQNKLSDISFGIEPKRPWNPATNEFGKDPVRSAKAFVFSLLDHKVKATVDPLNLDQWRFFVVGSHVLDARLPSQKRIGLTRLKALGALEARYGEIARAVDQAIRVEGV